MNIALASFAINIAATSVNALVFAVFNSPVHGAFAVLSGLCAVVALLAIEAREAKDVRHGSY